MAIEIFCLNISPGMLAGNVHRIVAVFRILSADDWCGLNVQMSID
jgi:hypothetical protein